jgi:hypothetical protein
VSPAGTGLDGSLGYPEGNGGLGHRGVEQVAEDQRFGRGMGAVTGALRVVSRLLECRGPRSRFRPAPGTVRPVPSAADYPELPAIRSYLPKRSNSPFRTPPRKARHSSGVNLRTGPAQSRLLRMPTVPPGRLATSTQLPLA